MGQPRSPAAMRQLRTAVKAVLASRGVTLKDFRMHPDGDGVAVMCQSSPDGLYSQQPLEKVVAAIEASIKTHLAEGPGSFGIVTAGGEYKADAEEDSGEHIKTRNTSEINNQESLRMPEMECERYPTAGASKSKDPRVNKAKMETIQGLGAFQIDVFFKRFAKQNSDILMYEEWVQLISSIYGNYRLPQTFIDYVFKNILHGTEEGLSSDTFRTHFNKFWTQHKALLICWEEP